MAEDKKGFLLYADLIHTVEKMPSDKAGDLLKHVLRYVNDQNPQTDDLIVQLTFEPIKQQLKRDLKKFEESKKDRSEKGREGNLKRWNIDLYDKFKDGKLTLEEAEKIAYDRRSSPPDSIATNNIANIADNVNVNVSVNDSVSDILLEKETKENNTIVSVDLKNQPESKIDFNRLIEFFNKNRGSLPEVKKLTESRKKRLKSISDQYGKDLIKIVIEKARDSDFIQGRKTNWIGSFDWIFKPENFIKIAEDNYLNKNQTKQQSNGRISDEQRLSDILTGGKYDHLI